jgi:sugar lactone lactonase YvrE
MADKKLELVIDAKAALGEGPCWDSEKQLLYWVDIMGKKVHVYNPKENTNRTISVDGYPGAVVPRKSGGLVVAMNQGYYALDLETEQLTLLASPENEPKTNRFNDGKCDASGRFWAGTMGMGSSEPAGNLYFLDQDLKITHLLDGIGTSNGIAWSGDNKTMYYIDSPTKQVVAFDFDLSSGGIKNKRVVVNIPEGEGVPDGMTIDSEGMLWVAQWGGYKVSRWNPHTGERLEIISVPVERVTSCTFGGENLDELYITTAGGGSLSEEELEKQPHAGGVFRIKVGVKGTINYAFNG